MERRDAEGRQPPQGKPFRLSEYFSTLLGALVVVIVAGTVAHALLIEGTMETVSKAVLCGLVAAATGKALWDLWGRMRGVWGWGGQVGNHSFGSSTGVRFAESTDWVSNWTGERFLEQGRDFHA